MHLSYSPQAPPPAPVFDCQEHGEPAEGVQTQDSALEFSQAADLGSVDGVPGSKQEARKRMQRGGTAPAPRPLGYRDPPVQCAKTLEFGQWLVRLVFGPHCLSVGCFTGPS